MNTATSTVESHMGVIGGQQDRFLAQVAEELVRHHDQLLAKLLDDSQNNPLIHLNPYLLVEIVRQQSAWLHRLEQRIRVMEEPC